MAQGEYESAKEYSDIAAQCASLLCALEYDGAEAQATGLLELLDD
jgi:hypothetical protein